MVGNRDRGFTVVECYSVGINTVLAAGGFAILVAPLGVVSAIFIDQGGEQAGDVVETVIVGGHALVAVFPGAAGCFVWVAVGDFVENFSCQVVTAEVAVVDL